MAYAPIPAPTLKTVEEVQTYYNNELTRIAAQFALIEQGMFLPLLGAAPKKPREGQLAVSLGGVLGATAGLYEYRTGAWVKL